MTTCMSGTLAALLVLVTISAHAATRLPTQCQKNEGDGRVLMVDGRILPPNARFKVLSYRATRRDGDWSYGPCVLSVTTN